MTLIEIMLVVSIIAMLSAIAMPSFISARNTTQQNACINNLRQLSSAKDQASLAYYLSQGTAIAEATVNSYLRTGKAPLCPGGGNYSYNAIGRDPTCDIQKPRIHALEVPTPAGNQRR